MTQNDRIIGYMQTNGKITAKEAYEHLGVLRLGARIHDLRADGHKIMTTRKTGVNRFGDSVTYAEYRLYE